MPQQERLGPSWQNINFLKSGPWMLFIKYSLNFYFLFLSGIEKKLDLR